MKELIVSVKVGKSYKNRGWALKRASTYDLIPMLPYEEECDIVVDGISAKAHFNILPRIFYKKNEKELMDHLKMLSENSVERVDLKLLLNKSEEKSTESSSNDYEKLEEKLKFTEKLLNDIQDENLLLLDELNEYKSKYNGNDSFNKSNLPNGGQDVDEIIMLKNEIVSLKEKNMELEIEFAKLLKKWNSVKKYRKMIKEFKSKLEEVDYD